MKIILVVLFTCLTMGLSAQKFKVSTTTSSSKLPTIGTEERWTEWIYRVSVKSVYVTITPYEVSISDGTNETFVLEEVTNRFVGHCTDNMIKFTGEEYNATSVTKTSKSHVTILIFHHDDGKTTVQINYPTLMIAYTNEI